MKKFVQKILIFVSLIFVIAWPVDIIISKLFQPSKDLYSWQELYSGEIDADLLIFGSSRGQKSFNMHIIEDSLNINAYDLGLINSRMPITYLRLLEYLRLAKHKPKYVTLELDWFTFENVNNISRHWQVFPYMLYNKNMFRCTYGMEGYKKIYYFVPLVRYVGNFRDLVKNSMERPIEKIYKGGFPQNTPFRINAHNKVCDIAPDSSKFTMLYDFINTCKDNNIKLSFVYAPEHSLVKEKVTNYDDFYNFIKRTAEANSIPFADFANCDFCQDTAFFYDIRHVNGRGADKFTSEYYVPWIKQLYGL